MTSISKEKNKNDQKIRTNHNTFKNGLKTITIGTYLSIELVTTVLTKLEYLIDKITDQLFQSKYLIGIKTFKFHHQNM